MKEKLAADLQSVEEKERLKVEEIDGALGS